GAGGAGEHFGHEAPVAGKRTVQLERQRAIVSLVPEPRVGGLEAAPPPRSRREPVDVLGERAPVRHRWHGGGEGDEVVVHPHDLVGQHVAPGGGEDVVVDVALLVGAEPVASDVEHAGDPGRAVADDHHVAGRQVRFERAEAVAEFVVLVAGADEVDVGTHPSALLTASRSPTTRTGPMRPAATNSSTASTTPWVRAR